MPAIVFVFVGGQFDGLTLRSNDPEEQELVAWFLLVTDGGAVGHAFSPAAPYRVGAAATYLIHEQIAQPDGSVVLDCRPVEVRPPFHELHSNAWRPRPVTIGTM